MIDWNINPAAGLVQDMIFTGCGVCLMGFLLFACYGLFERRK